MISKPHGIILLFTILYKTDFSASFISTRIAPIKHTFINNENRPTVNPFSTVCDNNMRQMLSQESQDIISNKIPIEWQGEVLSKLSKIIDPDLNRDIVTLGFVKKLLYGIEGEKVKVSFDLELTTPACPIKDAFVEQCKDVLDELDWVDDVDVTITSQEVQQNAVNGGILAGLSSIKSIVAVSSCKGGVGKSTTAVNLAYALQSLGGSVGILDVDIYGPSLPTMITPDDENVRFVGRQIAPLQRNGVKLMSFGYINDDAAVMRGPMVNQLLDQLLGLTYWGPLDYLILDMPPGTGDIQLTLSQRLNITAAVIVTTPQELSFVDVKRGIEMFDSVNVPSIAVVENMAYLDTSETNHDNQEWEQSLQQSFLEKLQQSNSDNEHNMKLAKELIQIVKENQKQEKIKLFGDGHKNKLSNQYGIKHIFDIPLLPKIAKQGDIGTPFILQYPDSEQAYVFKDLASSVVSEIAKIKFNGLQHGPFIFDKDMNEITTTTNDQHTLTIKPKKLREECKCASCVEELTGKQILLPSMVSETIVPLSMTPCGNYALNVDWSDGHKSLYPYRQILDLMRDSDDVKQEKKKEDVVVL